MSNLLRRGLAGSVAALGPGRTVAGAFALLYVVLTSCGDEPASPALPVPTTISLEPSAVSLEALGESSLVWATVFDQNREPMGGATLEWLSDDASVATVSARGEVEAVGNGTTKVRVRSGDAEGTVDVAVAQGVAFLDLLADSIVLADPGDTLSLAVAVEDAGGAAIPDAGVVWSSRDTAVARVDPTGLLRAEGPGTVRVFASAGGFVDSVSVRVVPELRIRVVGATPADGVVAAELPLSARVEDLSGAPYPGARVSWSVAPGSGSIASALESTSDATGAVGGVWRLGTLPGTQRAYASIATRGRVETIEFVANVAPGQPVAATLVADSVLLSGRGETAFLAPVYVDEFDNPVSGGTGVTWSSSDSSVATIAPDGLLTAGNEGTAWIVGSMEGPPDSILVTVAMRGAITITFDDGWLSVYENAWPILRELDLPANVAVNPGPVDGGWGGYMTEPMLDELHAAGWSMVSHTMYHDSLPNLSEAEMDWDLRTSQQWLVDRGYSGWNVFVAPYHAYGVREREAVSRYYTAARGVSSNIVAPDSLVSWRPDSPYLLTGREAEFVPYTTPTGRAELRSLLQRTVDEGTFLDVFFHQVPLGDVDAMRAFLEIVADFRDRVLPYHRLYPLWARSVY